MTEIERHRAMVKWAEMYGPRARQKRKGVLREAWPEFRPKRGKRRRRTESHRNREDRNERYQEARGRRLARYLRAEIARTAWPDDMRGHPEDLVRFYVQFWSWHGRRKGSNMPRREADAARNAVAWALKDRDFQPVPF